MCGQFSNLLTISLKFENTKYSKAVEWMKNILFNTIFQIEKIKIVISKLINDITNFKNKATNITKSTSKFINFDKKKSKI
jgi:Zn-dependent M16 (insulinase) family peptidase